MLIGLVVLVLLSVNLGGLSSAILQLGRGEWLNALGSVLMLVVLDVLGFTLLRGLRQR
ncbi:hypothetical protein K7W42_01320 [Deinococcus sp. HMF7604]|uniref:hypothetical protein n=1 Tax=Deinococcus TaxID=1298 RepID=UPI0018DCC209|nr:MULTISPECIES: hypothetical protein [Deinococcus]MBZ9749493.1 hypothetical protein [Deinococcus betulae]